MPLTLRPATAEDATQLTDIYFSAFTIDAISLLVFPRSTRAPWDWWHASILDEVADPHSHFLCITDPSSPTPEKILSYCKWNSPFAPLPTVSDLPSWPEGGDHALANHFFGSLVSSHERIMRGRKHWYLELVATRPECQGKGAAGKLLRWGIERADEEGTEAYLEASPDGKPIYEHLGFREVGRLVVELEGNGDGSLAEKEFVECFMVRPVTEKK
jgi:ribosomal protein S18 acetylase RimI-like enzyme